MKYATKEQYSEVASKVEDLLLQCIASLEEELPLELISLKDEAGDLLVIDEDGYLQFWYGLYLHDIMTPASYITHIIEDTLMNIELDSLIDISITKSSLMIDGLDNHSEIHVVILRPHDENWRDIVIKNNDGNLQWKTIVDYDVFLRLKILRENIPGYWDEIKMHLCRLIEMNENPLVTVMELYFQAIYNVYDDHYGD